MLVSDELLLKLNLKANDFVEKYKDISVSKLLKENSVEIKAKNYLSILTKKLVESSGLLADESELNNQSIKPKTIKLDKFGRVKESMSFPTFEYKELVNEDWESSEIRDMFNRILYLFVVYQQKGKETYLQRIIIWKMPKDVLENDVKKVWERTKECIQEGKIVKYIDKNGRYFTFFPSSTENPYVHVRPHARNFNDAYVLPTVDQFTGLNAYQKHCFWLNRNYISKIIKKCR